MKWNQKTGDELKDIIKAALLDDGANHVGFEEENISFGLYKGFLAWSGVGTTDSILKDMRMVKTADEVEKIKPLSKSPRRCIN